MTRPAAELTYLAAPYTHNDKAIEAARFAAVTRKAAQWFAAGRLAFSPLTHSHPIARLLGPAAGDWKTWAAFDTAMVRACPRFAVYRLPGFDTSTGVAAEIKLAKGLGRTIDYVDPTALALAALERDAETFRLLDHLQLSAAATRAGYVPDTIEAGQ